MLGIRCFVLDFGASGITNLRILFGNLALRRVKGLRVKDAQGIERPLIQLPAKVVRVIAIEQTAATKLLYANLFKQSKTAAMVLLESKNQYMNLLVCGSCSGFDIIFRATVSKCFA